MSNTIWKERWSALDAVIDGYVQELASQQDLQIITLKNLLSRLRIFGKKQFDFFDRGFSENLFEDLPEIPREHALYIIISQVSNDLEIIQRAIAQRSVGSSTMKATLEKADDLAWDALQLAVDTELISLSPPPAIITYFQKSPSIRIVPYASIALIGIPYTCMRVPLDLAAIYHEIGHYVYWKGSKGGEQTYQKISDTILYELDKLNSADRKFSTFPHWCYDWREEIFADIYGCMVGHVPLAIGFQEWLLRTSLSDFFKDDGTHPVPSVRAQIYINTLGRMNSNVEEDVNVRWLELFSLRASKLVTSTSTNIDDLGKELLPDIPTNSSEPYDMDAILIRRKKAADLERRKNVKIDVFEPKNDINTTEVNITDAIESLINSGISTKPVDVVSAIIFEYLTADGTLTIPKLLNEFKYQRSDASELNSEVGSIWLEWVNKKLGLTVDFSTSSMSLIDENGVSNTPEYVLPSDAWQSILFADGWITIPALNPIPKKNIHVIYK